MLVWQADDADFGTPPLADDEFEVFGARMRVPGYYMLDSWGGIHASYGPVLPGPVSPYFGFDIARDLELVSSGGFVVLDGFGGIHSGGGASVPMTTHYWGIDVVRDIELAPVGYYLMDEHGRIVEGDGAPFIFSRYNTFGCPKPVLPRDFELSPGGGLVLDGNGVVYGYVAFDGERATLPPAGFVEGAAAVLELR